MPQFAFVQQAFCSLGFRRVTQVLSDHQGDSRLVGGVNHVPALLHGNRHGLLDDDMFAGFGGGDGQRRVGVVGGADVDRLDVGIAQHFVDIQVDGVDAGFFRKLLGKRFNEVANGVELNPIGTFEVRGQVCAGMPPAPTMPTLSGLDMVPPTWSFLVEGWKNNRSWRAETGGKACPRQRRC